MLCRGWWVLCPIGLSNMMGHVSCPKPPILLRSRRRTQDSCCLLGTWGLICGPKPRAHVARALEAGPSSSAVVQPCSSPQSAQPVPTEQRGACPAPREDGRRQEATWHRTLTLTRRWRLVMVPEQALEDGEGRWSSQRAEGTFIRGISPTSRCPPYWVFSNPSILVP